MAHLSVNFKSKALKMPVMVDMLIPQGHGNYKTLYLLHGAGGDHTTWLYRSRIADYVENKDIAVIMPSGNNKCFVDNANGKDYYSFVAEELPEYIENVFSVSKESCNRYIAGMSMGGYGAFYAALRNPDRYNTAFSYSGLLDMKKVIEKGSFLDIKTVFGCEKEYEISGYNLKNLLKNVENFGLKLIADCADEDFTIESNRDFYKNAVAAGVNIKLYEGSGGHDFNYWDKCIKDTVDFIFTDGCGGKYGCN